MGFVSPTTKVPVRIRFCEDEGWVLEGDGGRADLPLLLLIPCRTPLFSDLGSDCFLKRLIHVDGDDGASLTCLFSPTLGSPLGDIVSRCQVYRMPIVSAEDRFSYVQLVVYVLFSQYMKFLGRHST